MAQLKLTGSLIQNREKLQGGEDIDEHSLDQDIP